MKLEGKRALLTGASSGIGRAVAKVLGAAGVRLCLTARRMDALQTLADEIEGMGAERPLALAADLSRRGEAKMLAARATERLGRIDILVNNAAGTTEGPQWVLGDDDAVRDMFETNYFSPLALIQALVPAMRARDDGALVNVTSVTSIVPPPLVGHYSSTKAALSVATETLRLELRGTGVHVLQVMPGPVETAMLGEYREVAGSSALLARMPHGNAQTLAREIVRSLRRGKKVLVYPGALGVLRHFPTLARWATALATRGIVQDIAPAPPR